MFISEILYIMVEKLTFGSIFAGIGGFDLAFSSVGFAGKWAIEWDGKCQNILRKHFPDSKLYGDVSDVASSSLDKVSVITFGSPCQDLSHAGKRVGLMGSRSKMFFEAMRIVKDIDPLVAIWENVTGSLSSNNGNDFLSVIKHMSINGNRNVAYRILDSQYFGVPQRRRRVFVVSTHKGIDPRNILSMKDIHAEYINDNDCEFENVFSIQDVRPIDKRQNGRGWSSDDVAYTVDTKATQGVAMHPIGTTYGFKPGQSSSARTDGSSVEVCPTLETGGGGNNKPAIASVSENCFVVRRITPQEAERLQGFPEGWTSAGVDTKNNPIIQSNTIRFNQLGNAVTVNVAEWIAINVKKEIKNKAS